MGLGAALLLHSTLLPVNLWLQVTTPLLHSLLSNCFSSDQSQSFYPVLLSRAYIVMYRHTTCVLCMQIRQALLH